MTPETEIIGPVQQVQDKGADSAPCSPCPRSNRSAEFIRASKAENTLRGYQSDWRDFCAWCEAHGLCPLPAAS